MIFGLILNLIKANRTLGWLLMHAPFVMKPFQLVGLGGILQCLSFLILSYGVISFSFYVCVNSLQRFQEKMKMLYLWKVVIQRYGFLCEGWLFVHFIFRCFGEFFVLSFLQVVFFKLPNVKDHGSHFHLNFLKVQ